MSEVYSTLLDYLLPERCPLCQQSTRRGYCDGCREEFRRVDNPCPRCALARPVAHCPREKGGWFIDEIIAPFSYTRPVTEQIHALKFSGRRHLGRALGLVLAETLSGPGLSVDSVVAVPLHRRRLLERGFNQALEIARPLAAELGLRLLTSGIAKTGATRPQVELDAEARLVNVNETFSVSRRLDGVSVAIVDDVLTTGATVNSLASALRSAGARRVDAWVVARVL